MIEYEILRTTQKELVLQFQKTVLTKKLCQTDAPQVSRENFLDFFTTST